MPLIGNRVETGSSNNTSTTTVRAATPPRFRRIVESGEQIVTVGHVMSASSSGTSAAVAIYVKEPAEAVGTAILVYESPLIAAATGTGYPEITYELPEPFDLSAYAGKEAFAAIGKLTASNTLRGVLDAEASSASLNAGEFPDPYGAAPGNTTAPAVFAVTELAANPTLSGTLVTDLANNTPYTGQAEFTITASTEQGAASILPADTTVTPAANGAWSLSDAGLTVGNTYWVDLYYQNPGDPTDTLAWSGYLTAQ